MRKPLFGWPGIISAVTLLAVFGFDSYAAASEPTPADIQYAVDFRENLGFSHDVDFVRSTFDLPDQFPDTAWGLPLSPEEAEDLQSRLRLRPKIQPAIDWAAAKADYGGMYFDQTASGAAYFMTTGSVSEWTTELAAKLPPAVEFTVVKVTHPLRHLEVVADRIAADAAELRDRGIPVVEIGADPVTNATLVGLERRTPGAEKLLREEYGETVSTEVVGAALFDGCTGNDRSNCRPLKGGIKIVAPDGGTCTAAFVGVNLDNGNQRLMSAGHCIAVHGGNGLTWSHNSNSFGQSHAHTLTSAHYDTTDQAYRGDVGWYDINSDENLGDRRKFFATSSTDIRTFDYRATDASQQLDDIVCRSGITTHWKCGVIVGRNKRRMTTGGYWIKPVFVINKDAQNGDSGAPLIQTRIVGTDTIYGAAGIHSHSVADSCTTDPDLECKSWYTTHEQMVSETGFAACTASTC